MDVYITRGARFLPNNPIDNDDMEKITLRSMILIYWHVELDHQSSLYHLMVLWFMVSLEEAKTLKLYHLRDHAAQGSMLLNMRLWL